jgi:excisionase family DNA binding protein
MPKTMFSDRDVAEFLACSRSTIWRWVEAGVLPKPIKIGGVSRWKLEDLEAVIEAASSRREAA